MEETTTTLIRSRLAGIRTRVTTLENRFGEGRLGQDAIRDLGRELARNNEILQHARAYEKIAADLDSARALVDDPEMCDLAAIEVAELEERLIEEEEKLLTWLRPVDPHAGEPVYLEIRAGTGGEEAALFAADAYRMYLRYGENHGWVVEELHRNETGLNGLREVVCRIVGSSVWEDLKYESGVHRVQRIPVTESGGRIHTSTITVALMPEIKDVEVLIRSDDIKVDVYRSSGPGGQGVNTTDSAVRITHLPTGTVVTCQTERSQLKNKEAAMRVLAARLAAQAEAESAAAHSEMRRLQVGTGDRSERIRTYNFPQNRLTDHRIGFTLYKLEMVMEGDLTELFAALAAADAREALGAVLKPGRNDVDGSKSA